MALNGRKGIIAALLATLLTGTFLSLMLTGLWENYWTPMLVIALPMATMAVIALSSICVWGLFLTIPMYYLARAALRGGVLWRILLPMLFMQAILTTVNHVLSGLIGWRLGGWCVLYELLLLAVSLLVVGPARVKAAFLNCYGELKAQLAILKAQDAQPEKTDSSFPKSDASGAPLNPDAKTETKE